MMLLHQHSIFLLKLLFIACIASHFNAEARKHRAPDLSNAEEEEEETVRVIVGFLDLEEENAFIKQQLVRQRTGSSRKSKIRYQFEKAQAVAMEVSKSELEEMKADSRFSFVEEDILVPVAGGGTAIPTNASAIEDRARTLAEMTSYGIALTQSDRTVNPDPYSGQECTVYACVVDSGVYLDHEDIPYSRGDGYADGVVFGVPEGEEWYHPRDTDHGTNVAGIMIATGGNDRGIVGVIPQGPQSSNVCLLVAKVVADGSGVAWVSSLLSGSEWCAKEAGDKPVVINLSFAVDFKTKVEEGVYNRLYNNGALIVAAAGNLGTSDYAYPASHDSVISVGSVTAGSSHSSFSQYNDQVELAAPGTDILVAQAGTNTIATSSGTSLASPFVAGIAAKIWAANPRCSNQEIRHALRETARRVGIGTPNREFGYGVIRARWAHDYLQESGCNSMPSTQPTQVPSGSPSLAPSIGCQDHLESCIDDAECCDGYFCRRLTDELEDSLVCRRESMSSPTAIASRPRLSSVDNGSCRGGFAGGCDVQS